MTRRLRRHLLAFARATRGAAATEFAIWLLVLVPAFLGIADLGTYVFRGVQVNNAAQAAAQSGWTHCTITPCSAGTLNAFLPNAILYGSALGAAVTEVADQRAQGFYCADASTKALTSSATATCASGAKAGWYLKLRVSYSYQPIFPTWSLVSLLPNPIIRDAWIRPEMSKLSAFGRASDGATTAEFALVLIPTLALVFGVIHICLAMYASNRLNFATEAAARCRVVSASSAYSGATCSDDSKTESYFNQLYHGPTAAPTFAIVDDTSCGKRVNTSTTYRINAVIFVRTIALSARACFPTA